MDAVIPPVAGSTNKREAVDFILLEPNEKGICFVTKATGENEKLSGLWFAW
jgi:hypothetical protein